MLLTGLVSLKSTTQGPYSIWVNKRVGLVTKNDQRCMAPQTIAKKVLKRVTENRKVEKEQHNDLTFYYWQGQML